MHTYPYIVTVFSTGRKLIIYVEHMSVKLWKMSFKVVSKTVEDREKSKEGKKKTLPTHTHKISFRRATTENNLKINNLIVKLPYPIQYLKDPKIS